MSGSHSEPMIFTGVVTFPGEVGDQVLVTIWPNGQGEVAFRAHSGQTWSPPSELRRESDE